MANEAALRQRIGQLLREHGFFVQAIESSTNPGIPDMYVRKNHACWIEFKKIKEMPKRSTTAIFASMNHPLSNEQIVWLEKEIDHGGYGFILVSYDRDYFLVPGTYADIFNTYTETTLRQFQCTKSDIPIIIERKLVCQKKL